MTTASRKKRVWTVADFARHAYGGDDSPPACRRARRHLKRLDAKHGGQLLIPTTGTNREFTFYVAKLARLEAELFSPVESLEFRVDEIESIVEDSYSRLSTDQKIIASQTTQNSRDIAKLKARVQAA